MYGNSTGSSNTSVGSTALDFNSTGSGNTAIGLGALVVNNTGNNNTAIGNGSLTSNTTGNNNIAIGVGGGYQLTGDNNIDIGNGGVADEANTIRIGDQATQTATFIAGINGVDKSSGNPVFIDANGQLGTGTALQGPPGPTGSPGPQGPQGFGLTTGAIIQLMQGSPAPAGGFTKIGTNSFQYHDLTGHNHVVNIDVYQKN